MRNNSTTTTAATTYSTSRGRTVKNFQRGDLMSEWLGHIPQGGLDIFLFVIPFTLSPMLPVCLFTVIYEIKAIK